MAYGLRVRDATGAIILDTSDRISRNVYISGQVSTDGNSGSLSQLSGKSSVEFCVPINLGGAAETAHKVYRSSDTIYWETFSLGWFTPATCIVFSFLYD